MDGFLFGKIAMILEFEQMMESGSSDQDLVLAASKILLDRDSLSKIAYDQDSDFALGASSACSDLMTARSSYFASGAASSDYRDWAEEIVYLLKKANDLPDDNPYKIFGVPQGTPISEIKKIYRNMVKQEHPDRTGGEPSEKFKEITEAWSYLTKPKQELGDPSPPSAAVQPTSAPQPTSASQPTSAPQAGGQAPPLQKKPMIGPRGAALGGAAAGFGGGALAGAAGVAGLAGAGLLAKKIMDRRRAKQQQMQGAPRPQGY